MEILMGLTFAQDIIQYFFVTTLKENYQKKCIASPLHYKHETCFSFSLFYRYTVIVCCTVLAPGMRNVAIIFFY